MLIVLVAIVVGGVGVSSQSTACFLPLVLMVEVGLGMSLKRLKVEALHHYRFDRVDTETAPVVLN